MHIILNSKKNELELLSVKSGDKLELIIEKVIQEEGEKIILVQPVLGPKTEEYPSSMDLMF